MNFYFNDQINVCAEEPWVVEYLIENGFCKNEDEALDGLHTCRNFYGWFDCEVSLTIETFFEKTIDKQLKVCYNNYRNKGKELIP